ncbi:unnamed protein product [Lactuca saligna]|uniref:Serine/threonine-protein kinase TOR n=1 Tax=Lactuca saligna TaxID=75948 RepID=A0AA36EPB5_LACSI|nr:unnamed protein product [Lactuca saligna]
MKPLSNISLSNIGFSLHSRPDYLNATLCFSLAAISYNDKHEAWEPLVEPVDGVLRIVEALLDGAASTKREVVVATLGQVVQSTGYVIAPYNEYPQLGLLLKLLNSELAWSTRSEVLMVLGIMGALDPHVHKRNQQSLQGPLGDGTHATNDTCPHIQSSDELPMDFWPSFATSEDYFSTVAISSLIRILRDPYLSSYHQKVVGSLMFIFKSMGLGCVPYLPKVLPDFFHTICTCEDTLKEFITWKLGTLVSIVRQHKEYDEIEGRLQRRRPLIVASVAAPKSI